MPYLKPLPEISEANQPFWDGLRRREFLVPKCRDCGDYNWTPYPACRSCLSESLDWTAISGDGTLYSFTVVWRGPGGFGEDVPYVIGIAEMKEAPRPVMVMSNLINVNPDDVKVGMPIRIAYEDIPDEDVTLYRFEPA